MSDNDAELLGLAMDSIRPQMEALYGAPRREPTLLWPMLPESLTFDDLAELSAEDLRPIVALLVAALAPALPWQVFSAIPPSAWAGMARTLRRRVSLTGGDIMDTEHMVKVVSPHPLDLLRLMAGHEQAVIHKTSDGFVAYVPAR
jgi:hypothetical protein